MTIETKEQIRIEGIQAHKELDKKIRNCKNCCPVLKGEQYCDDCRMVVIEFMDKYGAGVLTNDETMEEIDKLLEDYKNKIRVLIDKMQQKMRSLRK